MWKEQQGYRASSWSPGIDSLAVFSNGKDKSSQYKWDEFTIGVGPALKYVSPKTVRPWQWTLKTRLLYTQTMGNNSVSGYKVTQRDYSIYPYTEYIKRADDEWFLGISAEAKIAFYKSINSSYSKDSPNNPNSAIITIFSQHEFNDYIQGRLSLSGLYLSWNDKAGIELAPEFRLNESIMLGVKGARIGSDSIITGFFRIEFGKPLRDLYYQ